MDTLTFIFKASLLTALLAGVIIATEYIAGELDRWLKLRNTRAKARGRVKW